MDDKDLRNKSLLGNYLSVLNNSLAKFTADPLENITILVTMMGELFNATCALYNQLDDGLLYSVGQWNTPPDYNPIDNPNGHICFEVIKTGANEPLIINNLPETRYAQTDPNVAKYKLQSYVGQAVRCDRQYVGSLCMVFQHDFTPTEEEKIVLNILTSMVGMEEKRRRTEIELKSYRDKFKSMLEERTAELTVVNRRLNYEVSYRKKIEISLRESEARYRQLFDVSPASILVVQNGRYVLANPIAAQRLGFKDPAEVVGVPVIQTISPAYRDLIVERLIYGDMAEPNPSMELEVLRRDGSTLMMESISVPIMIKGELAMMVLGQDISQRKQAEQERQNHEQLITAMLEMERQNAQTKAVLLKEVNHRVNNNLAAIMGLLSLERSRLVKTDPIRQVLDNLGLRVNSLAMVHRMLSAVEWSPLLLTALVKTVAESVLMADDRGKEIELQVTPASVVVSSRTAHNLALVINELTTNALKYAWLAEQPGFIKVTVSCQEGKVSLLFKDNGAGYPPEVLENNRHHVGLGLIRSIVVQGLGGEVDLYNEGGAVTVLNFFEEG